MARQAPPLLWVSIVAVGLISAILLGVGMRHGSVQSLSSAALNVVLMWGLARGHKWAYAVVLAFGLLGIAVASRHSAALAVAVAVGNGLVLVPMLLSTRYFFPTSANE